MSKRNPFVVLGVSENCSQSEAYDAYIKLRDKYRMDRLSSGSKGNEAAERLAELDEAYNEVLDIQRGRVSYSGTDSSGSSSTDSLSDVEALLKENKIDQAQAALDNMSERSAEWHYLQAVVYLKRNWTNDCRVQLETAINMEPYNQKYQNALNKLNAKVNNTGANNNQNNGFNNGAQYQNDPTMQQRSYSQGGRRGMSACDCCSCALCTDCCCESMGGDCIPCC